MKDEPMVTKIAFVVDEGAKQGEEIRFVSMKLDNEPWTAPISWKSATDGQYWRRAFLLFARFYEHTDTSRPLRECPNESGVPVLIHPEDDDYDDWRFLAKYWFGKHDDIRKPVTTPRKKAERRQQFALDRLFYRGGDREESPWITVRGPLPLDAILLCTEPVHESPMWPKGNVAVPEGLLESSRIEKVEQARQVFRELSDKVANTERADPNLTQEPSWISAYKDVLASLIPEYPLCLTLQEEETKVDPTGTSSPILPSALILDPGLGSQRMLITGPSGAGKSTLLRFLANQLMTQKLQPSPERMVVLVQLNLFKKKRHSNLSELALDSMCSLFHEAKCSLGADARSNLKRWLKSDQSRAAGISYYLDGYNEIPYERRLGARGVDRLIHRFLTTHHGSVIISTMAALCPPQFSPHIYHLQEPGDDAIRQFVDAKLGDVKHHCFTTQLLHDSRYRSLTKNPFFLALLVDLARQYSEKTKTVTVELPRSRSALLDEIVERSIKRKFEKEGLQHPGKSLLSLSYVMSGLSEIAHTIVQNPARRVRFPDGIAHIVPNPTDREVVIRTAVLAGFLQHINFDSTSVDQPIAYSHDLLRDYFAARHIKRRFELSSVDLKVQYLEYRRWDEPLCLFAEMCEDRQTLKRVLDEIAQENIFLASELALRATHCEASHIVSLICGHAYWDVIQESTVNVTSNSIFHRPFQQLSCKFATRLLMALDASKLLRARRALPESSWLWRNIISAFGAQDLRTGGENLLTCFPRSYGELLLVLEGLSRLGTSDALVQAAILLDLVARDFDQSEGTGSPEQCEFMRRCSSLFSGWGNMLDPDHLIIILNGVHLKEPGRSVLPHTLRNTVFSERHIRDLLFLACTDIDYAFLPLSAIGRVGGAGAVDAIIEFTKGLVKAYGDVRSSRLIAHCLDGILSGLAATGELRLAAFALGSVMGCLPQHCTICTGRIRTRPAQADDRLAWNRMLMKLVSLAADPRYLFRHLVFETMDGETHDELQFFANSHPEFPVRHEARRALAMARCNSRPEEIVEEIEKLLERGQLNPQDILEYIALEPQMLDSPEMKEVRERDFLALWGIAYFHFVMERIGSHATEATLDACARLCLNEGLPLGFRANCCLFLVQNGRRPSPKLVAALLYERSLSQILLEGDTLLAALCNSLSEDEAAQVLWRMREIDAFVYGHRDLFLDAPCGAIAHSGHLWLVRFGWFLLEGRERRYLQLPDSWSRGLRSVPQDYKPDGFDEFVSIVT